MTAAQFADKIGISPSSLSHILSGRNNPSLEVVMKIHKACDYISLDGLPSGNYGSFPGPLFDENSLFASNGTNASEYRKETEVKTSVIPPKEIVREEIKYIERPARKITEIRIFFDNGTYETFRPEK